MLAQCVELLLSLDNGNARDLTPVRVQVHVAQGGEELAVLEEEEVALVQGYHEVFELAPEVAFGVDGAFLSLGRRGALLGLFTS